MGPFALLVATPVFGMALQLHAAALVMPATTPRVLTSVVALTADAELGVDTEASTDNEPEAADPEALYVEQMRSREDLAGVHRVLGISTWGFMLATVAGGFVQYYNQYGFFADQASSPCVKGTAIFGQGQCSGVPWLHAIGAGITTLLYASTFTLSLLMPDPDNLAEGPGEFASTLRLHKLLRWIHFGGMIAQAVLGVLVANSQALGLDRANDYGTLQTLATVHMATGLVTFGALTWAGALMAF